MADLRAFLQSLFAQAGGAISFEDFMAMALYDPTFGYYSAGISDVGGPRGDFATSATLSGGLSRAIAKWVEEEIDHHEWSGPATIIEVGAGNGALAHGILKSFGWWKRRRLRYRIVDVSAPLRAKQKTELSGLGVTWHGTLPEALDAADGRALVLSNELIDAFPARCLRWSDEDNDWLEVFVAFEPESGLRETFRKLPRDFPRDNFSAFAIEAPTDGQRIEIQPMVQRWLANAAEHLTSGSLLTIDYGGMASEIYERKPVGSLRGYFRQERVAGGQIYARFGKQDLTVDANFGDLIEWGEDFGLKRIRYETQREFLTRHDESDDPMAGPGPGEAFRVLHQRKD